MNVSLQKTLLLLAFAGLALLAGIECVVLYVALSAGGLRGNITLSQEREAAIVHIAVHLTHARPSHTATKLWQYEWTVNEFPVFHDLKNPCSTNELGKAEHDMTRRHGPIQVPPLAGTHQTFEDSELALFGRKSVWGKSVSLRALNASAEVRACANIRSAGDVRTALATFTEGVAGTVLLRENERGETLVLSALFYTGEEYKSGTRNEWRLLVTDILDTKRDKKCEYLQTVLDPDHVDDTLCSAEEHKRCKVGDLTRKHGLAVIGANNNRYAKRALIDLNLPLDHVGSSRALYLALYDRSSNANKKAVACARVERVQPREVRAVFSMDGVKGSVLMSQSYRTDPTVVTVHLEGLRGRGKWYQIHEWPISALSALSAMSARDLCSQESVGARHNPFAVEAKSAPAPGQGTSDEYAVGDLSGKYGALSEEQALDVFVGIYVDFNLPLFGAHSVVGRSVVVRRDDGQRWICADIGYPGPVLTAEATFRFPVVGRVVLRQLRDQPFAETTVLAQLAYSDGSRNTTSGHNWHVHNNAHNQDFYNWSRRCESAGAHFNPFAVGMGRTYANLCGPDNQLRCEVGDLSAKHQKLKIGAAGAEPKLFYSDTLLPLSGPSWQSVIGRSVVIHDDLAPQQRGNRMACAVVRVVHPLTAAVRQWRTSSGITSNVSGAVVLHQENAWQATTAKVDLHGLEGLAGGYHVHKVWVPVDKEFPCASDSLYGHFNPLAVDVSLGPFPQVGSVDQYEAGDLSGKFGPLDGASGKRAEFSDANLALFGPHSVIGRSVVVHKKEKSFRWVCGTIRAEERKDRAREIVALASFDDARHLVHGFVRFRQFQYNDGSLSPTWLEVDLRHPGAHNRNVTHAHDWAVFVSAVGADAFNQIDSVRCLAAGYRWNPFLSKDDVPHYRSECQRNALRCAMGDLGGKHGALSVGAERRVVSDENLPLALNHTVMGRALVLFRANGSRVALACANIRPDVHLVANVAVRKNPAFTVSRFMQHMRTLLNAQDWLVVPDVALTRDVSGGDCVQLTVNFYGSEAQKLQVEFSNLLNLGSIKRSTSQGVEAVSTFYRPCRTLNDSANGGANSRETSLLLIVLMFSYFI